RCVAAVRGSCTDSTTWTTTRSWQRSRPPAMDALTHRYAEAPQLLRVRLLMHGDRAALAQVEGFVGSRLAGDAGGWVVETPADCGCVRSAGHRAAMMPAVNPCSSTLRLTV